MAVAPSIIFQTVDRDGNLVSVRSLPIGTQSSEGSVSITPAYDASFHIGSVPQSMIAVSEYVNITPSDTEVLSGLIGLRAHCTVAGDVIVGGANDSTYTWSLGIGVNQLPDSVRLVKATGLTASATFIGLK